MHTQREAAPQVIIRPLRQEELPTADSIFRRAFGTFLGLPDTEQFEPGVDSIVTRWTADPTRVFAAEYDGRLVGTNIASNWGSVGFVGPLSVSPELWNQGVGQVLMVAVMEQFAAWGTQHRGLFTFPNSPKHIHLYEKHGLFARFLTPIMSKPIEPQANPAAHWSSFSILSKSERAEAVTACRALTDAVYDGLDLTREIEAVYAQQLGDTVLLFEDSQLLGFAVCHCGEDTEAGRDTCFVKFGAVQPSATASQQFLRLLEACEAFTASRGMARLSAGVNMGCDAAYRQMCNHGFRADFNGIAMQQANEAGYNRPDRYVISDWR